MISIFQLNSKLLPAEQLSIMTCKCTIIIVSTTCFRFQRDCRLWEVLSDLKKRNSSKTWWKWFANYWRIIKMGLDKALLYAKFWLDSWWSSHRRGNHNNSFLKYLKYSLDFERCHKWFLENLYIFRTWLHYFVILSWFRFR